MTALLLLALLLLVVIGWLKLRDQIQAIESRLHWSSKQDLKMFERQNAELAARVLRLEQQLGLSEVAQPVQAPARMPHTQVDAPLKAPQTQGKPRAISATPPILQSAPRNAVWADRLRGLIGHREWETLLAGSVMNKIGALLVVIGIALFLGYSFQRVSPAGRAGTALLISIGILAAGIVLERRQQYRVFSRGFIGAGWAVLYTTAYAVYALPAAQIISNPFAGSILLLAVSAGMIAHSLRYRVQTITALAYFTAFAALAVTPSTPFAVQSLIPLAASLLYLSWRFKWHAMALFGLFATYATCISRASSNAPLYATTLLFITYWSLFELFDVLRARRGARGAGLTWIFPLNATAFLALTYQLWLTHEPQVMWRIAAVSAFLFLGSAMLRILVRPKIETAVADPFDSIRNGTYEAPVTVAAVLAGAALIGRLTGFWTNISLAFEAEILYLTGVRFRSRLLRALGRSGFAASLTDLFFTSAHDFGAVSILGVSLQSWTPSVIMHAFLFYLNRAVWRSVNFYSFAATALVALIIVAELAPDIAPLGLFALALCLLEFALRKRLIEFRIQSYVLASTAAMLVLWARPFVPHAPASVWAPSTEAAVACWLFTVRNVLFHSEELPAGEAAHVRDLFAIAGSGFALLTLWMLLPGAFTAIPWTILALVWLSIAYRCKLNSFLWIAAGVLAMAYARLLAVNLTVTWPHQNLAEQWLIPLLVMGALYCFWNIFRRVPKGLEPSFASVFTWLAAIVGLCLFYLEVDRLYVVGVWAAVAIFLLVVGLRMNVKAFRWQSYTILALAGVCCLFINFAQSGTDSFARIFGASLLGSLLFTAEFLLRRNESALGPGERHARTLFSVAAVLLVASLLYHEVSGGLLTVAWGLEALACLGSGFPARERILRLNGFAIFALCILKLFIYDLRNLETVYRILSFVALGVILLSVSWIYARFRTQIQRYL